MCACYVYILICTYFSRIFSILGEKSLVQLTIDDDGHGLWNINFVDVSIAQLAKASMISWATRIGAVPGSIPESKTHLQLY